MTLATMPHLVVDHSSSLSCSTCQGLQAFNKGQEGWLSPTERASVSAVGTLFESHAGMSLPSAVRRRVQAFGYVKRV